MFYSKAEFIVFADTAGVNFDAYDTKKSFLDLFIDRAKHFLVYEDLPAYRSMMLPFINPVLNGQLVHSTDKLAFLIRGVCLKANSARYKMRYKSILYDQEVVTLKKKYLIYLHQKMRVIHHFFNYYDTLA